MAQNMFTENIYLHISKSNHKNYSKTHHTPPFLIAYFCVYLSHLHDQINFNTRQRQCCF